MMRIPIEIMNRHVHLSEKDAEILFGKGVKLTPDRPLSQPGQFIAKESVDLQGPEGRLDKVNIFGPWRKQTQVEILAMDASTLGIDAPINVSGNFKHSAGVSIIGPQGTLELTEGVIVAKRHLHITVAEAEAIGLSDGESIKIKAGTTERGLIFDNVVVRVRDTAVLDFHIDVEEANSAGLEKGAWGEII